MTFLVGLVLLTQEGGESIKLKKPQPASYELSMS